MTTIFHPSNFNTDYFLACLFCLGHAKVCHKLRILHFMTCKMRATKQRILTLWQAKWILILASIPIKNAMYSFSLQTAFSLSATFNMAFRKLPDFFQYANSLLPCSFLKLYAHFQRRPRPKAAGPLSTNHQLLFRCSHSSPLWKSAMLVLPR